MERGIMLFSHCWSRSDFFKGVGQGGVRPLQSNKFPFWQRARAAVTQHPAVCFQFQSTSLFLPWPLSSWSCEESILYAHRREMCTPVLMPAGTRGQWFRYNGNLSVRLLVCKMPQSVNCRPQAPVGFSLVIKRQKFAELDYTSPLGAGNLFIDW